VAYRQLLTLTVSIVEEGDGSLWSQVEQEGPGVDRSPRPIWNIEQCSDCSLLSQELWTCLASSMSTFLATTTHRNCDEIGQCRAS
jgi:hypothetical protein